MKIDAQGYDYQVMTGVLPASSRVTMVSLECQDVTDPDKLLYKGALTLQQIRTNMAREGWTFVMNDINNMEVKEVNAYFVWDAGKRSTNFINKERFPFLMESDIKKIGDKNI